MTKSNEPIIQHYVPQLILRKFCGEKNQLNVFDKHEERSFKSNPKNIASERHFYRFLADEQVISLEEALGEIENNVSPVFEGLLDTKSLTRLSAEDRELFAYFMAIQSSRTRERREQSKSLLTSLASVLKERFDIDLETEIGNLDESGAERDITKNPVASVLFDGILEADELIPYFENRYWVLGINESSTPLWISDNPVVVSVMVNADPKPKNLGLAVKGTELHFPLSPQLVLIMYCKETIANLKREYQNELARAILTPGKKSAAKVNLLKENFNNLFHDRSIGLNAEAVKHSNSLQVSQSYRYVMSPQDNFDLAKQMLKDSKVYKTGRRVEVQ